MAANDILGMPKAGTSRDPGWRLGAVGGRDPWGRSAGRRVMKSLGEASGRGAHEIFGGRPAGRQLIRSWEEASRRVSGEVRETK